MTEQRYAKELRESEKSRQQKQAKKMKQHQCRWGKKGTTVFALKQQQNERNQTNGANKMKRRCIQNFIYGDR